jgi:hypothetical protein
MPGIWQIRRLLGHKDRWLIRMEPRRFLDGIMLMVFREDEIGFWILQMKVIMMGLCHGTCWAVFQTDDGFLEASI